MKRLAEARSEPLGQAAADDQQLIHGGEQGVQGADRARGGEQGDGATGPREEPTGGSSELPTLGARSIGFKTPFL